MTRTGRPVRLLTDVMVSIGSVFKVKTFDDWFLNPGMSPRRQERAIFES
jgi:hypothetical protein